MKALRLRALSLLLPSGLLDVPRHFVNTGLRRYANQVPYDPKRFFDSFYGAATEGELDDRYTVSPDVDPVDAKYHYNAVENSIILALKRFRPQLSTVARVLDIGSGSGHWIDFYRSYYRPSAIYGVDIAQPAVEFLEAKYAESSDVTVICADVTDDGFHLDGTFQLINAIGVLFHIVEDAKWRTALRNLAACLSTDGIMLVGGQFGLTTQNVQAHKTDDFESWDEVRESTAPSVRVNKRLRSLGTWKAAASEAGLVVRGLQLTKRQQAVGTPENNVLIVSRRPDL